MRRILVLTWLIAGLAVAPAFGEEDDFEVLIEIDLNFPVIGTYPYEHALVDVTLEKGSGVLYGFDLTFSYAYEITELQTVLWGDNIRGGACPWEYLSYRLEPSSVAHYNIPVGLIRVVGNADTDGGVGCPISELPAVLLSLDFLVLNNPSYECGWAPVRFHWNDCDDNVLSVSSGDLGATTINAVESRVWRVNHGYGPPYLEKTEEPDSLPTWDGLPESCLESSDAERSVGFYNGGVDIACDWWWEVRRGDLDFDRNPYTTDDLLILFNYMLIGSAAFPEPYREWAEFETDINGDGVYGSAADLAYMVHLHQGDALPIYRLSTVDVSYTLSGDVLSVYDEVGAVYLEVRARQSVTRLASEVDLWSTYDEDSNVTRIVVLSWQGEAFSGPILEVSGEILSIEMASPVGGMARLHPLPAQPTLSQNYPNPFNSSTTIRFGLDQPGHYDITIYNVHGQSVHSFDGNVDAGYHEVNWNANDVASGVYFYRLTTSGSTQVKKMLLLK